MQLWKSTLTSPNNKIYTCTLLDIADAPALKRLRIQDGTSEVFAAVVEPRHEGLYIKEIAVQGENLHLGFRKENGMLLPADRKEGDTWQVSTEGKKHHIARIRCAMTVTLVAVEAQTLSLSVKIDVNVRAPFKKINQTVEAVVSINPHTSFQIERLQLANGEIYEIAADASAKEI